MKAAHVDCFSGSLADLSRGHRTKLDALRALAEDPLVSTFDRGTEWVEGLIGDLLSNDLIIEGGGVAYPWHCFVLTAEGRAMLAKEMSS